MITVIENGHNNMSTNPRQDYISLNVNTFQWVISRVDWGL